MPRVQEKSNWASNRDLNIHWLARLPLAHADSERPAWNEKQMGEFPET